MTYELKLSDGSVATWEGDSGEAAAVRYVDAMRVAGKEVTVVAWRTPRYGIHVGTPKEES